MAENGKYLIGESLREKLKSTIAKVDALSPGAPVKRIETVHQGMPAVTPRVLRLSKTTSEWKKDKSQTLTIWSGDPPYEEPEAGNTVVAWNKWEDIAANEWVLIGAANGTWYVAERPGAGGKLHVGTYTGSWPGDSAGVGHAVYDKAADETYFVYNYLTPISGNGGTCVFGYDVNRNRYVLCNFDLTKLDNYKGGGTQVLGAEGAALKWIDTVICT